MVIQKGEQAQTGGMGTVGRVSPTGVTRQAADATTDANVGLRSANPTNATRFLSRLSVTRTICPQAVAQTHSLIMRQLMARTDGEM